MDEARGPLNHLVFKFDPNKPIVSLVLQEMYLIVIFETSISIYNCTTGDFLEERGRQDKSKYKVAAVNNNGNDVYICTHSNSTAKNSVQSEVF